jgi:hypothetical protein
MYVDRVYKDPVFPKAVGLSSIPPAIRGTVPLRAQGRDATGCVVAAASKPVQLIPGAITRLPLALEPEAGCIGSDAGAPDRPPLDGAPPDRTPEPPPPDAPPGADTAAADAPDPCAGGASTNACGSATCSGHTLTPAPLCNGSGACVPQGSVPCPRDLACSPDRAQCLERCSTNQDCVAPLVCDVGQGTCGPPKKDVGQPCAMGGECQSSSCVSGFCCNEACDGRCRACAKAVTGAADGTCANVAAGTAPPRAADCPVQAPCGNNGLCDGAGGCQRTGDGTRCGTYCCGTLATCHLVCAGGACSDQSGVMAADCNDSSPCSTDRCTSTGTTAVCVHDGACTGATSCCCVTLGIGILPSCAAADGCMAALGGRCVP